MLLYNLVFLCLVLCSVCFGDGCGDCMREIKGDRPTMVLEPDQIGRNAAAAAGPILDVRKNHDYSHASDHEVKDIYAYGAGLHSPDAIVGLSGFTNLQTLSLHGNQIEQIEGLEVLHQLVALNLSSNNITWMEGLSQLKNLRVLNLSNNRVREIAGLYGLVALRTLILSHNEISLLGGLSALHGSTYALQHLDVRDNVVQYLCELWILAGCSNLEEVVFESGGYTNPMCKESGYHSTLLSVAPRLLSLDGRSCMGHAPFLSTDAPSRVPSLWVNHHSYPKHQNPVESKIPQSPLEDENFFYSLYSTLFQQNDDAKGIRRSLHDGGHFDNHQKVNKKSWGQTHNLQKPHDSYDHQMQSMATQEHEFLDGDYAIREQNLHHIVKLKNFQQGIRRSVHANAENLIVNAFVEDCDVSPRHESSRGPGIPILDFKAQNPQAPVFKDKGNGLLQDTWIKPKDNNDPDNSFSGVVGTDNASRIVQIVGQQSKPALDEKTHTTQELATQTDSMSKPTSDQLCEEATHLQPKLNTITVLIDGNCSYTNVGKQHFLASLELYKKDNELLYLTKEKETLEDEFVAFKKLVVHERNNWQANEEHKSMVLKSLRVNLKGCKVELKNLRKKVVQTERELIVEVKYVESSIALEETKKLSALNAESSALKEALNSALNTYQVVDAALKDANEEKENAKKKLVSLSIDLEEQRSKVKIIAEMLVSCTHQERISRKECNRLNSELDMVCKLLRKNKDSEPGDLIEEQSALWQAQGRKEAESLSQPLLNELHQRLVTTQTMVVQARQENTKTLSSVKKLRDTMIQRMLDLEIAFEVVTEKEQGAKELITELSCIVSAQKTRAEWMQCKLLHLTASKEEVEHLRAEILRLQERNKVAEQKAVEAETLKCKLREHRSAKEAACAQFSSLIQENSKLASRAASLVHNFEEAENIIMAKIEVCENQEATIQQLKDELVEAKNALCISEANIKALEDNLLQRLHDEVEQKRELRNELTLQETIISEMEDELKLTKSAKYAAEQACKSLQQKVNDVDSMLRHVDQEISSVKTLYEGREKSISLERDDALAKVTVMQKKLEDVEGAATATMQAHFESTKMMEAKEQKSITALIQKDILIEDLKRKVLEMEAELYSRDLALETQKAISVAKVDQLSKVLEELREM